MKNFKSIMLIFLSTVLHTVMSMDKQGAVALPSESKRQFRINTAQGCVVNPLSVRKQRSSASSSDELSNELETTKKSGYVVCKASQITTRKKARAKTEDAKTLYDKAVSLHPTTSKSRLDTRSSIAQKIGFDSSVRRGDVRETITFLKVRNGLRTSYPLAIKLYAVMTNDADELSIHPCEAAIIPVRDICCIAESLAIFGNNERFLENFARITHGCEKLPTL